MKQAVRAINKLFVVIVLVFFYLIAIGLASIYYKISGLLVQQKKDSSYWQEGIGSKSKRKYFESAY